MQVANLFINGSKVITKDEPILGEDIKLSLDRDFTYSCIDTKMDIEVRFYCASGKNEIDLAYEEMGIDADGEIEIVDDCGTLSQFFKFRLDFKSYKSNSEFTTLGITDINSDWKSTLTNEVNVSEYLGNVDDFYVRNLPLVYNYSSENIYAQIDQDTLDTQHIAIWLPYPVPYNTIPATIPPASAPIFPFNRYFSHYIMPKSDQILNELEESDGLLMDFFVITEPYSDSVFYGKTMDESDIAGTITTGNVLTYSEIEPNPLFTNKLDSGTITISTNKTSFIANYIDITVVQTEMIEINEIIAIGIDYNNPRYIIKNVLTNNTYIFNATSPFSNTDLVSKSLSITTEVRENENLWIYYEVKYKQIEPTPAVYNAGTGNWNYSPINSVFFKNIEYSFDNSIDISFTLTKNVSTTITTISDIEPYHTKTKAYNGASVLGALFQTDYNLCQTPCFVDLWFSRGDYLRNKINVSDFIVKPSDFFSEFEKVVCCGLGYFYFNNGLTPQKRLMSVYDFYTDNTVPNQYIFNYPDLIDGEIKIDPFLSPYYKEIQIGYSNSKDTPKDVCKQNAYTIPNRSESIYSKVSDFIGSMFIVTKALRLGTQEQELEFDKNIFILSGTTIPASPANYNVTLSQSTGFLADNVDLNPTNTNGINRRYATVFNLFRHLYKWGFSLFSNKDTLRVVKYEGSSIYDLEILDSSGVSTNPYYPGLSDCKLPALNFEKVDRTVDNMYSMIQSNMYVPSVLTFSTAKLSTFDLIAMRAFQYDLFQVSDGTNTYYGNLISANLVNDVTEIKLLRRFKNGI
jgi:hypothetical protein